MTKRMVLMIVLFLLVMGSVGWYKYHSITGMMSMMKNADMRATVSTASATTERWQDQLEAVGSLRAMRGVDISNEVAGMVDEIHFNSGDDVKEGTLLLKLRSDDDVAKLKALQATAKLAGITYNRDKKQLKAEAVAQATVDNDQANLENAEAQAAEQKAVVDKKFIRAPFSGHLGIRNVDLGQYLTPGSAIVTLQALDPIYFDFNLPQQNIGQIKTGQKIVIHNDSYPNRTFEGKITAINPRVDTATRNVSARAALTNTDRALLPGMYATADIHTGAPGDFVTVPQTAIVYNPYGDTVFIVDNKGKNAKGENRLAVQQTFVTVGLTRGDQVQILKGIKSGDVVVTSGQLKLMNGAEILVDNSVTPSNNPAPHPKDQ